jgi:hypothetical protein
MADAPSLSRTVPPRTAPSLACAASAHAEKVQIYVRAKPDADIEGLLTYTVNHLAYGRSPVMLINVYDDDVAGMLC